MTPIRLGFLSTTAEKRPIVGGICVDTGTIPCQTFREAMIFFAGLVGRFVWR